MLLLSRPRGLDSQIENLCLDLLNLSNARSNPFNGIGVVRGDELGDFTLLYLLSPKLFRQGQF